ncbi:MAG: NAD-dependent epimerase/dehydratase family protein [Candidatus Dadabacteria bacterium]
MKAIVTGGTGFIGGKLVEALVDKGFEVRCLVRKTSNVSRLKELGVELFYGDLGDLEALRNLVATGDVVFHLAALVTDWGQADTFYKYNVLATKELLESSITHGIKRFVYMSSSTVVWKSDFWNIHKLIDIDETYPYTEKHNDHYNASKTQAEKLVLKYNGNEGLETTVVRPSNVWGAGDTVILPRVAMAAKKGILYPMGSGERFVTPCHVKNLANSLLLLAENNKAPGNIYFINDGVKIRYMDFLKKQLNASGIDWTPGFSIPYKFAYAVAASLEVIFKLIKSKKPPVLTKMAVAALSGTRSYSIKKARTDLGYEPWVNMDDGIEELREWVAQLGGTDELLKYVVKV